MRLCPPSRWDRVGIRGQISGQTGPRALEIGEDLPLVGIGCSLGHRSTFRGTAPVFLDLGHAITPFLLAVVRSFHRSRSSTAHVRAERADEPKLVSETFP
jgi:hypothetical protein